MTRIDAIRRALARWIDPGLPCSGCCPARRAPKPYGVAPMPAPRPDDGGRLSFGIIEKLGGRAAAVAIAAEAGRPVGAAMVPEGADPRLGLRGAGGGGRAARDRGGRGRFREHRGARARAKSSREAA